MGEWRVQIPAKLRPLLNPAMYKVAYGGRGGTKSWTFADIFLAEGVKRPIRVLCTREIQKSIKQSVHQLLKDRIKAKDTTNHYRVLDNEIRGRNGTKFVFSGLQEHTVDTIKSYEGIDYCWIEEGQTVSQRSLDILDPTIRKSGSELWISFNPMLDTDPVWKMFVENPPENCICIEINWRDNPWWNEVLDAKRLQFKATRSEEEYDNVWEGKTLPALPGAIFFKQVMQAMKEGRVGNVPYDPLLKVQVICDLGNLHNMFIALAQKRASECRVIYAMQGGYASIPEYSAHLKNTFPIYNWGSWWLPHDGFTPSRQTGKDDATILRALGWHVPAREEIVEMGVEEGIRYAQTKFAHFYIDKRNAELFFEASKRYCRVIHKQTGHPGAPMKNEWAHGGDTIRYLSLNFDSFRNEQRVWKIPQTGSFRIQDPSVGY